MANATSPVIQINEGKAGSLYHPHYAATTTGVCRASIARFIRKNNYTPVMVATDGVLIRKKDLICIPERYLDARSNLGEWEMEAQDVDAVVLMSGVYCYKTREPTSTRSFFYFDDGKLAIQKEPVHKTVSKERGSASYFRRNGQSWFEFLEENKDVSSFTVDVNRPYSMGQARRIVKENGEKIVNFNLMNIFEIQQFTLKACGDSSKRRYDENNKPETFNDLLHNCYDLKSWDSFHEIDYILSGGK